MKARILLFFMLMIPIVATAQNVDFLQEDHLLQLRSYNDPSIKEVKNEKFYLDPTRISVSESGLYLQTDYFLPLALNHLFQDQNGLFVVRRYYQFQCNTCRAVYNSKPSECSICKGTSFSPYGVD